MYTFKRKHAKTFQHIPLSVLDLVPVTDNGSPRISLQNSAALATHAEKWGFNRYWVAEHHNHKGIASSATSVVISHLASKTNEMRIGSGGVMLPNHATLVIAEQFGTLDALYPGRIDLGLGRAPGTDQMTAYALRRTLNQGAEAFPSQVEELQGYFAGTDRVHANPGEGATVPIWLLGSSGFSAGLAAEKGLPFSFASHFAAQNTIQAVDLYREKFKPSNMLDKPYVMLGLNVIAADTDEEAKLIATSQKQQFINLRLGIKSYLSAPNAALIGDVTQDSILDFNAKIVGGPETIRKEISTFIEKTGADELIITSQIYDPKAALKSYEIIAGLME